MGEYSEFKARITAELDTTQLEKDVKNLDKKIKLKVDTGDGKENINNVGTTIEKTTKKASGFGATIKKAFAFGSSAKLAHESIQLVKKSINDAVDSVKELDAAIADLRMATGKSYDEVSSLIKQYNALGQSIGATTLEVSNAADTWLRQGYSINQANKLIENSMVLSKVGQLDSADAAKYLTSAIKGFNVEAEKSMDIIDKLTAVDAVAAVDAGGLAEGMSRVATTANLVGITMDELIGYLAVVGETTQKSMSSVGNSFQTIFSRMASVKSGALEYIDEDGIAESLSDVETVLNAVGIQLRGTDGDFRNFGDVLDEVANTWSSYSSVQQSAIAKAFAGTRQYENFIVLMENYNKATEYTGVAISSAGTATQKYAAYLDSLEAKTNSLKAAFESLAFNTISADSIGGIVEAANAVVNFIDKTNLLKGTLLGLGTAGIIKAFTSLKVGISAAALKLNEFNSALKIVKAGNIGEKEVEQLAKMTSNLSQSQLKAVLSSKSLSNEQRIAILMTQGMTEAEAKAALSAMGLATAEGAATGTTVTLSGALKGLWATLMANPLTLIIGAITLVSSIFMTISQEVKQATEDARQSMLQLGEETAETVDDIERAYAEFDKYNKLIGTSDGDSSKLNESINTLNETLGGNKIAFENAAEGANDYANSINNAVSATLNDSWIDAKKTTAAAREALKDDVVGWFNSSKIKFEYGNIVQKRNGYSAEKQIIADILGDTYTKEKHYYFQGASTTAYLAAPKDADNMDDVVDYYYKLLEVQDKLAEQNLTDTDTYRSVTTTMAKMQSGVEDYTKAKYNELKLEYEVANGIPTTVEEYNALIESIVHSTFANAGLCEQLKTLASEDWADKIDFSPDVDSSTGADTVDKLTQSIRDYQSTISKLKDATDEYNESGSVSASTYKDLIALNKDYADLFDFSSGKIAIAADEINNLVDELISEYGATLAANGATEAQITQMVALAKSLSNVTDDTDDVVDSIQDLADILQDAVDGTEMTVFETWELLENYPELASAITKTTNGYILEEEAVRNLIKAKAELLGTEASEARVSARETLVKKANNAETANNVDRIFEDYYNKNGTNIKSFDEYVSAWEKYFGATARTDNWIPGLQDYVEAIIADINTNNVKNSLIEDMKNPDSLLKSTSADDNPISDAFDELESIYSGRLQELEYLTNTYNNAIQSLENQGYDVPAEYYEKLKDVEEQKIKLLGEELNDLTDKFQEAINAGEIEEGSKEWYDMNNAINSVKESIQESTLAVQEFSNTIRDLEWQKFDDIQDEIKKITEEADFLLDLMDDKDMVDEKGNMTEYGNAAMGLHGVNYNVYMEQAQKYADEIAKIEKELASDEYNQDLIERKEELLEAQRDSILAAEEEKQAIVDLVKEGFDAELDSLDDLIDKYKDALDSVKDLYDYQNKVSDITDEISVLQKKIIAYENDTSEETKSQIQKLKVELKKSQEELQETEYDQFIADQKKLLDNLYDSAETIFNARIDDIDGVVNSSIDAINNNASDIKSTLETTASGVGTTLSDKMGTIWTITNDCKSVVSTYSGNFDTAAGEVNSNLGTINTTINDTVDTIVEGIDESYGKIASDISSSISGLASNIDGLKGALTKTDNSGDASNPDDNSSGGSGGSGGSSGGNNIKEYAPDTIITDTDTKPKDTSKTKDTSKETTKTETPKVKSNEEIIAEKIVKFGDASGRGMNAEKSGDNGIITWNGKEYKVQNSGTAHDSSTPLYKAAVNVLGFSDRQIFGYGGKVYGYLDNHIQEIEGRFWSKKGYENFVSDMQAHYPAYKDGGLIDYTGLAWVDGTKEKPEMVLNAEETKALSSIHEWLPELAKKYENITFADSITPAGYFAPMSFASNAPDYSDKLSQIQNNHNETKVEQNFEITIPIEKVEDYNDFVTKLRDDPKFEKMIQSMTIGRINGGSRNAKLSYSWK